LFTRDVSGAEEIRHLNLSSFFSAVLLLLKFKSKCRAANFIRYISKQQGIGLKEEAHRQAYKKTGK
jgi:hypothetical protein